MSAVETVTKEEESVEESATTQFVGQSIFRVDGHEKVTGSAIYTMDMVLPRMLHIKLKRSPIPHGKIISIDTEHALKLPGVRAVLIARDVPDMRRSLIKDMPIFAIDRVRYVGEPVAAVAAEDIETAEEAVELIEVKYEELPGVFDPEAALSPDSMVIHPERAKFFEGRGSAGHENFQFQTDPSRPNVSHFYRAIQGDTHESMLNADVVVESDFRTTPLHAFHMESIATLASADINGGLTIWTSAQMPHQIRQEVAEVLGIEPTRVRVIIPYVGGGYGTKDVHSMAALMTVFMSLRTKRPVKLVFTREESITASAVRYPFVIRVKDGVSRNGKILAREVTAIGNGGAYAGTAGSMNIPLRFVHTAVSTYNIPNINIESMAVFTNQSPAGSFRGFGSAQAAWALESQMDIIAEKLGLDPVEVRLQNLTFKDGDKNALGEVMRYKYEGDYLKKAAQVMRGEREKVKKREENSLWKTGIGFAVSNKIGTDPGSSAYVRLRDDGTVELWTSAVEIGQGIYTGLVQIVAQELGVGLKHVRVRMPDTDFTPFDMGTYSSHTLFGAGNAIKVACADLKGKLIQRASKLLDTTEDNLVAKDGKVMAKDGSGRILRYAELFTKNVMRGGALTESGSDYWGMGTWTVKTSRLDPSTWKYPSGRAGGFYSPVAEGARVAVNTETGQVKILEFVVVMNVGLAVNPALVEGQVEGSVAMGLSCTMAEELVLESGKMLNADLKDYKVHGSLDAVRVTFLSEAHPLEDGPYGAKGVGEPAITPVAPAVANAIYDAVGVRITDLPITAEKVMRGVRARSRAP